MAFKLIVFVLLFVFFFGFEWRVLRTRRDPEWEEAMKSTPWRDRRRIAKRVSAGERLDNPREAALAAGMAERQLRFNESLRHLAPARIGLGSVILLLAALAGSATVGALGGFLVVAGLVTMRSDGRRRERVRQAERLNREQAAIEGEGAANRLPS